MLVSVGNVCTAECICVGRIEFVTIVTYTLVSGINPLFDCL